MEPLHFLENMERWGSHPKHRSDKLDAAISELEDAISQGDPAECE